MVDATGACVPATAGTDPKNECTANAANCTQDTCDGQGTCHVPAGTQCSATTTCSGYTLSGSFCDANGACVASSQSCPGGELCDFSNASCSTQCYGSCQSGSYCSYVDYTCHPIGSVGDSCNPGNYGFDCSTGICSGSANGYICSNVRCGFCQQVDSTGNTCSYAPVGTDPGNDCTADGCNDGTCNGSGSCNAIAAQGSTCATSSCANGGQLTTYTCNYQNTCTSNFSYCDWGLTCASSTSCYASCTDVSQCRNSSTSYCATDTGHCWPKQDNGQICTSADQCTSGYCTPGQAEDRCSSLASCPTCQVIDSAGTTCVDADAGSDPKNDCIADAGFCEQETCDGKGTCHVPYGTACGASSCSGSNEVLSVCDSSGTCQQVTTPCPSSSSCASPSSCGAACTGPADCATGTWCDTSSGLCQPTWPDGTICSADDQCSGGHCLQGQNDKRCSSLASCPTCQVIDTNGASCVNATYYTDPKNDCTADTLNCKVDYCDGAGTCNASAGTQCGGVVCDANNGAVVTPTCNSSGVCQNVETFCANHTQCKVGQYNDCPPRCDARVGYYCLSGYTCIAYDECQ